VSPAASGLPRLLAARRPFQPDSTPLGRRQRPRRPPAIAERGTPREVAPRTRGDEVVQRGLPTRGSGYHVVNGRGWLPAPDTHTALGGENGPSDGLPARWRLPRPAHGPILALNCRNVTSAPSFGRGKIFVQGGVACPSMPSPAIRGHTRCHEQQLDLATRMETAAGCHLRPVRPCLLPLRWLRRDGRSCDTGCSRWDARPVQLAASLRLM
jgi:hypothetical protein